MFPVAGSELSRKGARKPERGVGGVGVPPARKRPQNARKRGRGGGNSCLHGVNTTNNHSRVILGCDSGGSEGGVVSPLPAIAWLGGGLAGCDPVGRIGVRICPRHKAVLLCSVQGGWGTPERPKRGCSRPFRSVVAGWSDSTHGGMLSGNYQPKEEPPQSLHQWGGLI